MQIRKLIPLALLAAVAIAPVAANADTVIPGVPPQLQQPAQQLQNQLPAAQQAQLAQFLRPLPQLPQAYSNNLDGWIRNAQFVMSQHGIPGSYDGIHRNIMRESGGNPRAINLNDSNAARGIPSKGLMQVIDPTFRAYHVDGTSWDIYDPVANISAACNYAAHRYGTIDRVFSAY
ncbi:transglycosylase SLT domain-containing protein [Nocardia miyunensis]|uniref:transglycosylase SLT domain-containing protein n=1 Tax=Nocardia miyunensis TaxID=282684 RepID=UPI00082D52C7|nr:transglycosylase SLT domain-containing protein [Nocardia miyunensis]